MRFLAKKTIFLALTVLTVFLLTNLAARGMFKDSIAERMVVAALAPIEDVLAQVGYGTRMRIGMFNELFTVYHTNQALRDEIESLRQERINTEEIMAENIRLKALLDYKQGVQQFDLVTARVIARDVNSWTNVLVINKGTADGLMKDMPVVSVRGLVGNIVQIGNNTAKVQLVLDPRSVVGGMVQRVESRAAGIVEGNAANRYAPRMITLPRDADIVQGDRIITSGFGGIYPKGIVIGEASEIINDDGGLLKYAVIAPAVDFDRLEEVMVIKRSREPMPAPLTPSRDSSSLTTGGVNLREAGRQ